MGQKINPLGFRLGKNQSHCSVWFAQPKSYYIVLQEDEKIRDCIKIYVQKNIRVSSSFEGIGIAHIEIEKKNGSDPGQNLYWIPKFGIEGQTQGIKKLQINVQKWLHFVNQRLNIAITRVAKPYRQHNILAEYIAI